MTRRANIAPPTSHRQLRPHDLSRGAVRSRDSRWARMGLNWTPAVPYACMRYNHVHVGTEHQSVGAWARACSVPVLDGSVDATCPAAILDNSASVHATCPVAILGNLCVVRTSTSTWDLDRGLDPVWKRNCNRPAVTMWPLNSRPRAGRPAMVHTPYVSPTVLMNKIF
jgi:hypothetical protein